MFLFGPCFSMKTPRRKSSICLDLKNQGKKSAKTRKLGFLRKDCAQGGEESRKPTKIQGEIQGSGKPCVLVGFLRQKKDCAVCTVHTPSKECSYGVPAPIKQRDGAVQQGGDWKKEKLREFCWNNCVIHFRQHLVSITFEHNWPQMNKYVTVAIVLKNSIGSLKTISIVLHN